MNTYTCTCERCEDREVHSYYKDDTEYLAPDGRFWSKVWGRND